MLTPDGFSKWWSDQNLPELSQKNLAEIRSEKEIWLATAELQKRKSNHQKQLKVRAKKLAEFLSTAEAEEVLLVQRLRDTQGREVFNIIDSGENKDEFLEPSNLTKIVAVVDSDKHLESLPHQDMPTQKPPSPRT